MAYDLSGITTKVQQRVRDTGYSTAEIANYINDAQNDACNEYHFRFMQTSTTFTATIGTADITAGAGLPTTFTLLIDITVTTASAEQLIPFIEKTELDRLYPDNADTSLYPNGPALYWYWDGKTPKVFPAPDKAYSYTVRFYKRPTALSSNTDLPDLPPDFEELLVVGAAYRVLQVKDQYDQAGVLQNKYDEILQKLVMRWSRPQTGRPTTMRINRHRALRPSSTRWR